PVPGAEPPPHEPNGAETLTGRFDTLLVANRGEIACRVLASARAMGLATVAVYSDADRDAPHVRLADRAVRLGPAPVAQSYLDADAILAAARAAGAQAIHPGYGFLSENAGFAHAVRAAGLVFVGPPADAIALMGDKARAKAHLADRGVPLVPGYQGCDQSDERLAAEAAAIGFPLMVKAAAGGGGRGMRRVNAAADLADALALARTEAEAAFGDPTLILERALVDARHVEVQVLADAHDTVVALGERDCSVQRRHQKIIEEAPCPALDADGRRAIAAAAVKAAQSVAYVGAGTVEFLLDAGGAFYFLEMNTRLQVEHPVTEMVTGLDLVAEQIRIAQGAALSPAVRDARPAGHAIEARLYAEDPDADFRPDTGAIRLWRPPAGAGIRVDAGIETGGAVTPFYDAMVAKVVAHGADRDDARRRLLAALDRTALLGVKTNRDYLIRALDHPVFAVGGATTGFVAAHMGAPAAGPDADADHEVATARAAAVAAWCLFARARDAACAAAPPMNAGMARDLLHWTSGPAVDTVIELVDEAGALHSCRLCPDPGATGAHGAIRARVGAHAWTLAPDPDCGTEAGPAPPADTPHSLRVDGQRVALAAAADGDGRLHLALGPRTWLFTEALAARAEQAATGDGTVTAPMHGTLVALDVGVGDRVTAGQRLGVLEAMKMQQDLRAPVAGLVCRVAAQAGDQVAARAAIVEIDADDAQTGADATTGKDAAAKPGPAQPPASQGEAR
ncbi:biotin carboxylase N-terminal domain-containing protein, partial [Rhodothalassium salexigens]|uniref:acetyl/propionyl/methylcrotonyl-CoA carboxylase subunit alpha n=1 Tax=Rhodothalassium salexigens TaxID=1086 RepID=UPI001913BFB1